MNRLGSALSRTRFVPRGAVGAIAAGFREIVSPRVLGRFAPSKRIHVGAICVGRISRGHDLPGTWKYDNARIMAVCDLDAGRVQQGKALISDVNAKKKGKPYNGGTGYTPVRPASSTRLRCTRTVICIGTRCTNESSRMMMRMPCWRASNVRNTPLWLRNGHF